MMRECQQMIISGTLLGIAENLVGTHDSAEFKSGIQVFRIDVRMDSLDRATDAALNSSASSFGSAPSRS
jgi:hypothetical protein